MSDIVISGIESVIPSIPVSSRTVASLVEDTRRLLYTNSRDQRDKLAGAIPASSTSLTLKYGVNTIQAGSLLSIDLEEFYVWEISGKIATVEPGQFGTLSAAHSKDAIVHINPKFSTFAIFKAINDTVHVLSALGLYRMQTVDLTWVSGTYGYNLTGVTDLTSIYQVLRKADTGGANTDLWPVVHDWSISRNMDLSEFSSGLALTINEGAVSGNPVRVLYKAPFVPFSSMEDNILSVSGIPEHLHDLLSIGAAIRLAAPREIKRNFDESQGDTRRASEVPPGANLNSYAGLALQFRQRVVDEKWRLTEMYPDRKPRLWDVGPTTRRRFG